jgi:ABC-type bacteriocin/lantibiotic exporter with double-glycine peptidase domain
MKTIVNGTAAASDAKDMFHACLEPLLQALRWRGTPRQLAEAVSAQDGMDLVDLRNTMANLDFASRVETIRLADIDPRLLPCLFIADGGDASIILAAEGSGAFVCFNGATGATATVEARQSRGDACFFTLDQQRTDAAVAQGGWVRALLRRFEGTFARLMAVSFFLSLLALAPAFFVQAVYDRVLATQERETLIYLAVGVGLVLLCDTFNRVVQRYAPHHEPAVAGASFDIRPGEIVAISGGNGSGKSSILKLVASLYQPQAGAVLIDGVDTRQINPLDLRQAIAYLPQHADLFDGTLADNLRFVNPAASDEALRDACAKAEVLAEIDALPAGFATQVSDQLPSRLTRKLALARTWLIDASIVLLDEPEAAHGDAGDDPLLHQLAALRGRSTVLLVTHTPRYVQAADHVIVLRQGMVVHDGSPQELMSRISR